LTCAPLQLKRAILNLSVAARTSRGSAGTDRRSDRTRLAPHELNRV
jgi:hypothetical protein